MSDETATALEAAGVRLRRGKSGKIRAAEIGAGRSLDDALWRQLAELPDLVKIDAAGADVRDPQVAILAAMPRLAQLDLSGTAITDQSLEHLQAAESLQLLTLTGTAVGKDALKQLRQVLLGARIVFL